MTAKTPLFDLPEAFDPDGTLIQGIPHSGDIGMRMHFANDGVAILSVPWDARLVGDPETGVLHGGVVTALLDTTCGAAVMSSGKRPGGTATLDLRIDYMRPARKSERILCRAECYRETRSISFTRATAYHDRTEELVATASGAFIRQKGTV
ncbi:MAG: PaaI family thioesterase [Pseudomonadota bacterium]